MGRPQSLVNALINLAINGGAALTTSPPPLIITRLMLPAMLIKMPNVFVSTSDASSTLQCLWGLLWLQTGAVGNGKAEVVVTLSD